MLGGLDLTRVRRLADVIDGYTYFQDGDVVVAKITPCFENGKGALVSGLLSGIGFGTTELHVLRPQSELEGRYLFYLTVSHRFRKLGEATMYGAGGQKRVADGYIREYRHRFPPLSTQRAIATFLDRKTAKIDALIEKKRRLLDLLDEKRAALITHAVTRGLDPDVPMKDLGVEWLGEVPEHWGVVPLKHVVSFINGYAFKPAEWELDGTPIIRIENLNGGDRFNSTMRQLSSKYCVVKGDLLFGWSGNRGTSFGPFRWWREGKHYVNQHIFKVVDYSFDKAWLYWTLRAVTSYVERQAHGIIGMVHITRGELGRISVPILPNRE